MNEPFLGHVNASKLAGGCTLRHLDENGHDRDIEFFSKKISSAEQVYTANDREFLSFVLFLERFIFSSSNQHFRY